MNRRSFIGNLASALAGFAILPPATTYERIWRATRKPVGFWTEMRWASLATPKHGIYDFLVGQRDRERIQRDATEAIMRYATAPSLEEVKICVPSPDELRRIFQT